MELFFAFVGVFTNKVSSASVARKIRGLPAKTPAMLKLH
jgi:hypothetical protein